MTKFICILAFCLSGPLWAGQEREGGDDLGLAFNQAFRTAYNYMNVNMPSVAESLKTLPTLALITKIIIVDEPLYVTVGNVKQESTAINEPSTNTIWINRTRWQEIQDAHVAEALALHEFACLAHLEETGRYTYSAQYVEQFGYQNGDMGHTEGGAPVPRLTVTNVTGVSWYEMTGGQVTVFGGTAGKPCSSADRFSTCDSCQTTVKCSTSAGQHQGPLCACSRTRIYDDLVATFKIAGGHGASLRAFRAGPGGVATSPINISNTSVSVRWSDVCQGIDGKSCEGMNSQEQVIVYEDTNEDEQWESSEPFFTINFKLQSPNSNKAGAGVISDFSVFGEPNGSGIGQFDLWPGDKRIYLKYLNSTVDFPTLQYGSIATAIRIFVSSRSMNEATVQGRDLEYDIPIASDGSIAQNFVPGLDNGKLYFVRLALLDQANNVVQYFPPMDHLPPSCLKTPSAACPYAVTPAAVSGKL